MSVFDKRKDNEPAPAGAAEDDNRSAPAPRTEPRAPMPLGVSAARDIAVIGSTITIRGELTGDESLVIDGKVEGTVLMRGSDLTVGQTGKVTASITANVVRIENEVTGNVTGVEKVVVTRTGRVQGDIVAPRVTLEDGARFKGRIDMDSESSRPAAAPQGPQALKSVPAGSGDEPRGDRADS